MTAVDWSAVSADGFLTADIVLQPFERVTLDGMKVEIYYTGSTPGTVRLFRDMKVHVGRVWMLADPDVESRSCTDDRWHFQPIA